MITFIVCTVLLLAFMLLIYGVGYVLSKYIKKQRYILIPLLVLLIISYFLVDGWSEYGMLMVVCLPSYAALWRGLDRGGVADSFDWDEFGASIGEELGDLISGKFLGNE